ncbi:hypothetical protein WR164_06350 [Philodulcilactobacillus myokoensis]|uniref:Uncharacterized protein n=1 Tax=Philodulcilactobacillus myokoensis TaxID=2929573 RepID=A0A9W6ES10_9LACO|nr:hypothetical protein WR164_06350 [Philodulcilactobacillus myokoensis]
MLKYGYHVFCNYDLGNYFGVLNNYRISTLYAKQNKNIGK